MAKRQLEHIKGSMRGCWRWRPAPKLGCLLPVGRAGPSGDVGAGIDVPHAIILRRSVVLPAPVAPKMATCLRRVSGAIVKISRLLLLPGLFFGADGEGVEHEGVLSNSTDERTPKYAWRVHSLTKARHPRPMTIPATLANCRIASATKTVIQFICVKSG